MVAPWPRLIFLLTERRHHGCKFSALHLKMNFERKVPRLLKQKLGIRFEPYRYRQTFYAEGAWSPRTGSESVKSYKLIFLYRGLNWGSSHGNSSPRSLASFPERPPSRLLTLHMGHNDLYIMFMGALNLFGVVSSHKCNRVSAASPKAGIP